MVQKKLTNLIRKFSSSFSSCGTRFWIGGEPKRKDLTFLGKGTEFTREPYRRVEHRPPENLPGKFGSRRRRKKRKYLGFPILDQNSHKFIHRNTLFIYIPFREREKMRERVFLSVQRVREWEREVGYRK